MSRLDPLAFTDLGSPPAPSGFDWFLDPVVRSNPSIDVSGTFYLLGQIRSTAGPHTYGIGFARGHVTDPAHITWETPRIVQTFGTFPGGGVALGCLTMDVDAMTSRVHVLYYNSIQALSALWHESSDDGGATWSAPVWVGNDSTLATGEPVLLSGTIAGKVTFFWEERDGDYNAILSRHSIDGGTTLSPTALVLRRPALYPAAPGGDNGASFTMAATTDRSGGPWTDAPVLGVMTAMNTLSDAFPSISGAPAISEIEPNDDAATSTQGAVVRSVLRGDLTSFTDRDFFAFDLNAGWIVSVWKDSAASGSGTVPIMDWMNSSGTVLLTGNAGYDTHLGFTAPADGKYYLRVMLNGTTPMGRYRIRTTFGSVPYPGASDQRDVALSLGEPGGASWTGLQLLSPLPPIGYDAAQLTLTWNDDGYLYANWADFGVAPGQALAREILRRSSDGGATWGPPVTLSSANSDWASGRYMGSQTAAISDGITMCFAWADTRNGDVDVYARNVVRKIESTNTILFAIAAPGQAVSLPVSLHNDDDLFPFELRLRGDVFGRNWGLLPVTTGSLAAGQSSQFTYSFTVPDTAAPGRVTFFVPIESGIAPNFTYVSDTLVLMITDPTDVGGAPSARLELRPVSPSPAHDFARVSYSLSRAGVVRVSVYSTDGRRMRELESGVESEGPHSLTWNGTDSRGMAVSAGAYFVRVQAEGRTLSRRLVWLR